MRRGWRFIYWITMALSGLWFILATYGLFYILSAIGEPSSKFYTGLKFTELVIVSVGILQPLFILWAIVRAFRMRANGSPMLVIGRAALPLSTAIFLALAVSGHRYNERLIYEKLDRQMRTGTITYDCSRESNAMDFDPKQIGTIDLRLTSTRRERQPQKWTVTWPGKAPIVAANFDVNTGSFGGSQGISWSDTGGKKMVAILSFSDIMGPYGTQSIWATVVEGDWPKIQETQDTLERSNFTCGPNPKTYQPAS